MFVTGANQFGSVNSHRLGTHFAERRRQQTRRQTLTRAGNRIQSARCQFAQQSGTVTEVTDLLKNRLDFSFHLRFPRGLMHQRAGGGGVLQAQFGGYGGRGVHITVRTCLRCFDQPVGDATHCRNDSHY
jgi:hypothetical protein